MPENTTKSQKNLIKLTDTDFTKQPVIVIIGFVIMLIVGLLGSPIIMKLIFQKESPKFVIEKCFLKPDTDIIVIADNKKAQRKKTLHVKFDGYDFPQGGVLFDSSNIFKWKFSLNNYPDIPHSLIKEGGHIIQVGFPGGALSVNLPVYFSCSPPVVKGKITNIDIFDKRILQINAGTKHQNPYDTISVDITFFHDGKEQNINIPVKQVKHQETGEFFFEFVTDIQGIPVIDKGDSNYTDPFILITVRDQAGNCYKHQETYDKFIAPGNISFGVNDLADITYRVLPNDNLEKTSIYFTLKPDQKAIRKLSDGQPAIILHVKSGSRNVRALIWKSNVKQSNPLTLVYRNNRNVGHSFTNTYLDESVVNNDTLTYKVEQTGINGNRFESEIIRYISPGNLQDTTKIIDNIKNSNSINFNENIQKTPSETLSIAQGEFMHELCKIEITTEIANIYKEITPDYSILGFGRSGDIFKSFSQNSLWYHIDFFGTPGYVSKADARIKNQSLASIQWLIIIFVISVIFIVWFLIRLRISKTVCSTKNNCLIIAKRDKVVKYSTTNSSGISISKYMKNNGYQITFAMDLNEVKDLIKDHLPNIIIIDFQFAANMHNILNEILTKCTFSKDFSLIFYNVKDSNKVKTNRFSGNHTIYLSENFTISDLSKSIYMGKSFSGNLLQSSKKLKENLIKKVTDITIEGKITEDSLSEFFQMIDFNKKTGCLLVENHHPMGMIFFENGIITYAITNSQVGEKAVFDILSMKYGRFQFLSGKKPTSRQMQLDIVAVLMEKAKEDENSSNDFSE